MSFFRSLATRLEDSYDSLPASPGSSKGTGGDDATNPYGSSRSRAFQRSWIRIAMLVSVVVNAIILVSDVRLAIAQSYRMPWKGIKPIYNPIVEEAVTHERVVWPAIDHKTIYHGPPSDETDQVWDGLYVPYGISMIEGWQNQRLRGESAPKPEADDGHKVSIDVTHHIQCLNLLRHLAWPDRYSGAPGNRYTLVGGKVPVDHVDHCINGIRESLMCNADFSPAVWQYNHELQQAEVRRDTVHTCRNYEKIQDWAQENSVPYTFGSNNFNQSTDYGMISSQDQLVAAGLVHDRKTITKNQVLQ